MPEWNVSILSRFEIRTGSGQSVSLRSRQYAEFLAILTLAGPRGIELRSIGPDFFSTDWTDQKKAIRNLLSRTRSHLAHYSEIELIQRDAEVASIIPTNCDCDLWQLRRELEKSSTNADHDQIERLLQAVSPYIFESDFCSSVATNLLKQLADDLLRGLEFLALQPSRAGLRSLAGNVINAIKPLIEFSTDLTQRQLALYGKLRMRQEIIETLADYSDFLADDLGDSVDRQLERFAESLLLEMDQTDPTQFGVPAPPQSIHTIGVQVEEAKVAIDDCQLLYIGGLPGVGKSHLLKCLANLTEFESLNTAFIDLADPARPISTGVLTARNPQIVFVNHYSASDAAEIERVRIACPNAKMVIAGDTDIGLDVEKRMTVLPWSLDATNPSRSAESLVRRLLAPRSLPPHHIKEIARLSNGLPGAVIQLQRLVEEFGVDLALHEFSVRRAGNAAALVRPEVLLENMRQMAPESQSAIRALVGFGQPVAGISLASCFQLSVSELRRLVSFGLIEFRKEDDAFIVPSLVREYLSQLEEFGPDNPSQLELEEWLVSKLAIAPPAEANRSDIFGLQQVILNQAGRNDFDNTLRSLVVLRPHLFVLQSCDIDLAGMDDRLYDLAPEPDRCVESLLAIGAGLFYQMNYGSIITMLENERWISRIAKASQKLRAEFYSQLGLAKSAIGDSEGGLLALQRAADLAEAPGLEAVLVRVLYNLATVWDKQALQAEAVGYLDRAVDLLSYVPTVAGRLELLHMRASYYSDLGGSLEEVKERFHVTLSYAKSHGLDAEAGWIMLSLGGHYVQRGKLLEAIVAFSTGLREQLSSDLTPETRCRCSFSCDVIAYCLHELGSTSLAYQGAMLALDTMDDYPTRNPGFQRLGITPIQLPEGLRKAKGFATGGDILLYLSRVQQVLRQFPDTQEMLREFGYLEELSPTDPTGM